jgi:hypothetical protein
MKFRLDFAVHKDIEDRKLLSYYCDRLPLHRLQMRCIQGRIDGIVLVLFLFHKQSFRIRRPTGILLDSSLRIWSLLDLHYSKSNYLHCFRKQD